MLHLNERLLRAEYAVRGPIVQRAQELEEAGRKVIYCNIGNPQALKQRPLTFLRQLLCLLEYPALIGKEDIAGLFPRDVVERARMILARHPHGTGAYTQSAGIPFIRQAVADFITRRDGVPSDSRRILLTDGASKGAQAVLTALLRSENDGFMVPIPQYPLYSASLTLYGGHRIDYYLDEQKGWQLSAEMLTKSIDAARARGINPVGIVVINPGNPTGAVLSPDNIAMIIDFARRCDLAVIADEVYQENVYAPGVAFHSFAKVMHGMGETAVPLFSLHSTSKGYLGECGHRGGYLELRNVPDDILAQFIKLQSIGLCANVPGQIATYAMVAPPREGDESYPVYAAERDGVLADLAHKATLLGEGLNRVPGLSVRVPEGAMYAFVRVELPPEPGVDEAQMSDTDRAEYAARRDEAYCLALLEETGICVVPGSGFGQWPGTLHFRTTFLPPRQDIDALVGRLGAFHQRYVETLSATAVATS